MTAIKQIWQKNRDILGNAGSLYAATVITSALGFVFWTTAARLFPPHDLGLAATAISAMTVLALIGMFGLNTLLIGELPQRKSKGGLIAAALVSAGAGSLVLGLAFVLVAPVLSRQFAGLRATPGVLLVFVGGVAVISLTGIFDEATIGLLRGHLQLWRNFIFAAAKLLLLPVAAFFVHDHFGTALLFSWVAGGMLSMGVLAGYFVLRRQPIFHKPDWNTLNGLRGLTVIHNWLNLAITVPWMLLPVIVTVTVGPSANAAFYAAWTVSGFLRLVPANLSTVLFALASGDIAELRPKLRFSLQTSMLVGIPGMAALCLGGPLILSFFGPSYARAGLFSLILLSLSYLPTVFKDHYIAVGRATGRIKHVAILLTITSCLGLAAAYCGGRVDGLTGLVIGVLAAATFEGIITAPRVIRAAAGHRARRRPASGQPQEIRLERAPGQRPVVAGSPAKTQARVVK
jgi:O-antigen/teichoic acid export membrane protein